MAPIQIGCSGWNYNHWRDGVFYPPRLAASKWLSFYAEHFGTVEVNATFYRLPAAAVVERWVERTPDDFVFAVKVSRYLTHVLRLRQLTEHLATLLDRLAPLAASPKLGPLLWQLPPAFARDDDRLASAVESFPPSYRHAIEFRHESWFDADVYRLLREHNVAVVIADRFGSPGVQCFELTADFAYVRFHAGSGNHAGNYSHDELDVWRGRLQTWATQGEVFAYFNNDQRGYAIENARYLQSALGSEFLTADRAPATARGNARP